MACACAPALNVLKVQLDNAFPKRDRDSDGCCGDPAHQARKSDHNPDASGFAHARDIDEDLDGASAWSPANPAPLKHWIPRLMADSRTKYVIYERHIYYPDGSVHPYSGANAHEHHLHLSIRAHSTHDISAWPLPRTTEDDMTPEQDARQKRIEADLKIIKEALIGPPGGGIRGSIINADNWRPTVDTKLDELLSKP